MKKIFILLILEFYLASYEKEFYLASYKKEFCLILQFFTVFYLNRHKSATGLSIVRKIGKFYKRIPLRTDAIILLYELFYIIRFYSIIFL